MTEFVKQQGLSEAFRRPTLIRRNRSAAFGLQQRGINGELQP